LYLHSVAAASVILRQIKRVASLRQISDLYRHHLDFLALIIDSAREQVNAACGCPLHSLSKLSSGLSLAP